ncbi:MAG: M56 family metallopeptidase [Candidatus Sumerlaeia bacterium]
MTSIMQILTGLPPAAAVLVKATALLAIGCLLSLFLSRRNPRWRVLVWRLAMAGLILIAPAEWLLPKLRLTVEPPPTPISAVSPAPGDPAMPSAARPVEVQTFETAAPALPPPPPSVVQTIAGHPLEIAVAAWLIAVILIAARSAYVVLRVRRLVRSASPAPDAIRHMGRSIAEALGCRAPDVRLTKDLLSPFVAGIARPVVVVPALLTEADRRDDLPAILAHELAHIRSRDLAWMALARWISILLWFHPLAWWMRRAHSAACEEVSDGVAAEHAGGAPAYSRALASTFLELVVDAPHPVGVPLIRPSEIMRRIQTLRRGIRTHRLARKKAVACTVAGILLVTSLTCIQFVHADKPEPAPGSVPAGQAQSSPDNPMSIRLSDGNIFELVGICDYYKNKNLWWRPDGTSMAAPFASTGSRLSWNADDSLVLVFRSRSRSERSGFGLSIHGSQTTSWANDLRNAAGEVIPDLQALVVTHPSVDETTTSIQAYVDDGPMVLQAVYRGKDKQDLRIDGKTMTINPPADVRGSVQVAASLPRMPAGTTLRAIAFDKRGKQYDGVNVNDRWSQTGHTCDLRFHNLMAADFDRIEFSLQPQTRVVIQNVSLSPDVKSKVHVEVKKAPMLTPASQELAGAAGTPVPVAEWRKKFDSVYRLGKDEYIKYLPPPFIPERLQYYSDDDPRQAQYIPKGPDAMIFRWDQLLRKEATLFGSPQRISWVLHNVIGLKSFDYDCPAELLKFNITGDWITRQGADTEKLLDGFVRVMESQFQRKITVKKRTIVREVIVAKGTLNIRPREDRAIFIDVYVDQISPSGRIGGCGDITQSLGAIGDLIGVAIIDESNPGRAYNYINRRIHPDTRNRDFTSNPTLIDKLLNNLSRQTSLEFKKERRPVEVWFISEETPPSGAAPEESAMAAPGASGTNSSVLHFPTSHTSGQVMVRERGAAGGWQEDWKLLASANGDVTVPADKDVALFMTEDEGTDLSFLDKFAPDDLKVLALESRLVADSDLKHIRHLTGLKALSLQGATIDGSGFQYLKDLKNLEELRLGNHGQPLKDESMAQLGRLTSLRWLALWGTGISDAGVENLRPLTRLRSLTLGNAKITDKSLEVIKGFDRLESLQLENTLITDDGLANLSALTRLKHVKLGRNNITDEGMEHIKGLTNLENVWIDNDPITDRGLACLAGMKNLKELYAEGTSITPDGLHMLKTMPSFTHLTISKMDDKGLDAICRLSKLEALDLPDCRITPAGIASLKKMSSLKRISISGTSDDTRLVKEMMAGLPNCKISCPQLQKVGAAQDMKWKERFDSIYRLEDGRSLKRIGRPFIPERLEYYKFIMPGQAEAIPSGPDMWNFKWDGSLRDRGASFGSGFNLRSAIRYATGLNECEFTGPNDILDIPDASDWIVREGAPIGQRLKEFESIVAKDLGRNIHFEKKTVDRDVIVVRGKYKLQLEPGADKNDGVFVYVDRLTKNDGAGGGGGGFDSFLKDLESHLNIRVIDESDTVNTVAVNYTLCRDSDQQSINSDPAKIDRLLKNLSRQTSLEFKKERRPVEVWFISEEKSSANTPPAARSDSRAERIARSRAAIEEALRQRQQQQR